MNNYRNARFGGKQIKGFHSIIQERPHVGFRAWKNWGLGYYYIPHEMDIKKVHRKHLLAQSYTDEGLLKWAINFFHSLLHRRYFSLYSHPIMWCQLACYLTAWYHSEQDLILNSVHNCLPVPFLVITSRVLNMGIQILYMFENESEKKKFSTVAK